MSDIRITDKFAKAIGAFRGRDVAKETRSAYIVQLSTQYTFKTPVTDNETDVFISTHGKYWFISVEGDTAQLAERVRVLYERYRDTSAELDRIARQLNECRDEIVFKVSENYRSKIVVFMYDSPDNALTFERMQKRLMPGHEIDSIGVRHIPSKSQSLYVAILDIPGTRNASVNRNYGDVRDIEDTRFHQNDFAGQVIKVIYDRNS